MANGGSPFGDEPDGLSESGQTKREPADPSLPQEITAEKWLAELASTGTLMPAWNAGRLLEGVPGVWQANTSCRLCGLPSLDIKADLDVRDGVPLALAQCGECKLTQLTAVTESESQDDLWWQDEPVLWLREREQPFLFTTPYLLAILREAAVSEVKHERLLWFSLDTLRRALALADLWAVDAWVDGITLSVLAEQAGDEVPEPTERLLSLGREEGAADEAALWAFFNSAAGGKK